MPSEDEMCAILSSFLGKDIQHANETCPEATVLKNRCLFWKRAKMQMATFQQFQADIGEKAKVIEDFDKEELTRMAVEQKKEAKNDTK